MSVKIVYLGINLRAVVCLLKHGSIWVAGRGDCFIQARNLQYVFIK
jgi:hypothetical protein